MRNIVFNIQHLAAVYVNVESALERKIYLSVLTNTATARAFNIRVSQLQEAVAPDGCLQYHTETAGFVQSFNYADKSEVVDFRRPSYFVSSPLTVLDGGFQAGRGDDADDDDGESTVCCSVFSRSVDNCCSWDANCICTTSGAKTAFDS